MDRLLLEFRHSPTAYLASRGISSQELVEELLQLLTSQSDRNDNAKLAALAVFQEGASKLLNDLTRLENTLTALKTIFQQFRSSATPLICSQILCAMTSILIEMESILEGDYLLIDLIHLLFDVVEKVTADGCLLVRATACDCLRELEITYPGILSSKIGHFYAMSQKENSHIFQSYLLLLTTVLEHTVKKHVLALELGHTPDSTLSDLLSHADTLKAYSLPDDFKQTAKHLLTKPLTTVLGEDMEMADVRRAVSFILDYYHLLTPSCLVLTLKSVLPTIELASLAPKILKSLMLHFQSCQNYLPFHLVLLLKWRFGSSICSGMEANAITMWFTLMAIHPSLPTYQRELMLSYHLQWPQHESLPSRPVTTDSEEEEEEAGREGENGEHELQDYQHMLLPSVFDTYGIYCYKVKALNFHLVEDGDKVRGDGEGTLLPQLLSTILKQVKYGIGGAPIVILFRLLFSYWFHQHQTTNSSDLHKLVADIVKNNSKYIPHMIDFISAIQSDFPDSSIPLRLLADYLHHLSTSQPITSHNLPLFLTFLKHASQHPNINPLVIIKFLTRVLHESSLCNDGTWNIGSAILNIINTIMRTHSTNSVFKGLTDLLQLVSTSYNDIDIQDRARFYHQLILSVSGEKLSAILSLASDSLSGSTLSDIIEARIADNAYPSAPSVQTITDTFLSLTRVDLSEEVSYGVDLDTPEECATVDEACLTKKNAGEKASFSLKYKMKFIYCPEGVSKQIYAAVIKLSTDGPYHSCPDVYVPYIACEGCGIPEQSCEKIVTLTFFPRQPIPAVFTPRVIFTTEEGMTCVCDLGNIINVTFEDVFQPLPSSPIPYQVNYMEVFHDLWTKLETSQTPVQDGSKFSVLSTLHLDISMKEWKFRAKRLQLLQIPPCSKEENSEVNGDSSCYLVYLPPCYHLLMRVCDDETGDGVSISLATDCWSILGLVNDYMHQITSGLTDNNILQ